MGKDDSLIISEFLNTESITSVSAHFSCHTQKYSKTIFFLSKWVCSHSDVNWIALEISLSFISIYSSNLIKRKKKNTKTAASASLWGPLLMKACPEVIISPFVHCKSNFQAVLRISVRKGKLDKGANKHITKENHMWPGFYKRCRQ